MNLYSPVRHETDPGFWKRYLLAFHHRFQNEQPERTPPFNFLYAAVARGQSFEDAFGTVGARTPAYYAFEMYRPHMGARLVPMRVQAPELAW